MLSIVWFGLFVLSVAGREECLGLATRLLNCEIELRSLTLGETGSCLEIWC